MQKLQSLMQMKNKLMMDKLSKKDQTKSPFVQQSPKNNDSNIINDKSQEYDIKQEKKDSEEQQSPQKLIEMEKDKMQNQKIQNKGSQIIQSQQVQAPQLDRQIIIENSIKICPQTSNKRNQINQDKIQKNPQTIVRQQESIDKLSIFNYPNISCSVDQQVQPQSVSNPNPTHVQQKLQVIQQSIQAQFRQSSKVEKKMKKITLKQLQKVKFCIKNLQSAIKGLEYLKQKMTYYPKTKKQIAKYLHKISQISNK